MTEIADFILDDRLPDIRYRTEAPEENVHPRVTTREGSLVVYLHNERKEAHKGFVPVGEFLRRLANREHGLAATGYRSNGRQTTISFNRSDRVTLSPRLEAHLSSLRAQRKGKSASVVAFLASLSPLYMHELHEGIWCARSLQDGTLIWPIDESDWDEERGAVRLHWQGDSERESLSDGEHIAAIAMERYVRLHGAGANEEAIAAELWFMVEHFRFKTGCDVYLPQLSAPPHPVVRLGRATLRIGEGVLAGVLSKLAGA